MPPAKKPKRPIAPNPAPAVNLPAAALDVEAGDDLVGEVVALPVVGVLPLVDFAVLALEAALEAEAEVEPDDASPTTPPDTGGWLLLSVGCDFWAAAWYSFKVLSWGLQRGQWLLHVEKGTCRNTCKGVCWGSAYGFKTMDWPPWQCPGLEQNIQTGFVSLTVTVKVLPYGSMTN